MGTWSLWDNELHENLRISFKSDDIKESHGIGRKTFKKGALPCNLKNTDPEQPAVPLRRSPRKRPYPEEKIRKTSPPSPEKLNEMDELKKQIESLQQENALLKKQVKCLNIKLQNHCYTYENISEDEK